MNEQVDDLTLYYYPSCPYCRMVVKVIASLSLDLPLKDILELPEAREELAQGGGRTTVPCLRIKHADGQIEWMFESRLIVNYLNERFHS